MQDTKMKQGGQQGPLDTGRHSGDDRAGADTQSLHTVFSDHGRAAFAEDDEDALFSAPLKGVTSGSADKGAPSDADGDEEGAERTMRMPAPSTEEGAPSAPGGNDADATVLAPPPFADEGGEEPDAARSGEWVVYDFGEDEVASGRAARKRTIIIATAVVAVVALIAVAAWFAFFRAPESTSRPVQRETVEQEEEAPAALTASFTVDAPEWVADYGPFGFTVTDESGAEIAALQVTPGTPSSLDLEAGTYTVAATQVPSLSDGRTYAYVPAHTLTLGEDTLKEAEPLTDAWSFAVIDPNDQAAVDAAVAALPADQQDAARAFYNERKAPEAETPAVAAEASAATAGDGDPAGTSASADSTSSRTPSYGYSGGGSTYAPPAGNASAPPASEPSQPVAPSTGNAGSGTGAGGSTTEVPGTGGSTEQGSGTEGGGTATPPSTGGDTGNTGTGGTTSNVDPEGPAPAAR